jgi:hypothetical protein
MTIAQLDEGEQVSYFVSMPDLTLLALVNFLYGNLNGLAPVTHDKIIQSSVSGEVVISHLV